MNKIDVTLSATGENMGIFHDFRYTNEREGGNSSEMTFEIRNVSGNDIIARAASYAKDPQTGKTELVWGTDAPFDAIRITIYGGIENSEFLQMLQLILEAEKMVEIIKP